MMPMLHSMAPRPPTLRDWTIRGPRNGGGNNQDDDNEEELQDEIEE